MHPSDFDLPAHTGSPLAGQMRRPLRHHRPDDPSDEATLAAVKEILDAIYLPGFAFVAQLVGGRVLVRPGMVDPEAPEGPRMIWGRAWSLREPIVPYDLAVAAKECAVKLAERTIESGFLLDNLAIFRK